MDTVALYIYQLEDNLGDEEYIVSIPKGYEIKYIYVDCNNKQDLIDCSKFHEKIEKIKNDIIGNKYKEDEYKPALRAIRETIKQILTSSIIESD